MLHAGKGEKEFKKMFQYYIAKLINKSPLKNRARLAIRVLFGKV